jgi:hypothetical protein
VATVLRLPGGGISARIECFKCTAAERTFDQRFLERSSARAGVVAMIDVRASQRERP